MGTQSNESTANSSRSPYGERGLKFENLCHLRIRRKSLSLRRAWIEIRTVRWQNTDCRSLSLRRAWIEIRTVRWQNTDCRSLSLRRAWIEIFDGGWRGGSRGGRSPYGERGLKSCCGRGLLDVQASLSLRRAWIEISNPRPWNGRHESLSLRRAWIEISTRPSPASA